MPLKNPHYLKIVNSYINLINKNHIGHFIMHLPHILSTDKYLYINSYA